MKRLFLAHPKAMLAEESLEELLRVVKSAAERDLSNCAVIAGRDDYASFAEQAGSWDAWCRDVVVRPDPMTQAPYYAGFLVLSLKLPPAVVGKATGSTISLALQLGRPVYVAVVDAKQVVTWHRASRCWQAGEDFKTGWRVG